MERLGGAITSLMDVVTNWMAVFSILEALEIDSLLVSVPQDVMKNNKENR